MPRKRTQSAIDKAWADFDKIFDNPDYVPDEGLSLEDLYALREGWSDRLERLYGLVPDPETQHEKLNYTYHGIVVGTDGKYQTFSSNDGDLMSTLVSPAYSDVWFADRIKLLLDYMKDADMQKALLELLNDIL